MERFKILLRSPVREQRRRRHELIEFFDALTLYLRVGWDLGHAWKETATLLSPNFTSDLKKWIRPEEGGLRQILHHLSLQYPNGEHRVWFSAIENLYQSGAAMGDAVQAVSQSLRREQRCDLENHCRLLPMKINVLLILFFLPPTLVLLFAPLVLEIGSVLSQ